MRRSSVMLLFLGALVVCVSARLAAGVRAGGDGPREDAQKSPKTSNEVGKPKFDVCDVSYLWPVPESAADVEALLSADKANAETNAAIWPAVAFGRMLEVVGSEAAVIKHPGGAVRRIGLLPEFRERKHWKVAAFRVDPGAPGGHSAIVAKFGAAPQLRLILQPVTAAGEKATVHDVTAHLVYNFVKEPQKAEKGFLPVNVPDTEKFTAVLADLADLKGFLKEKGIDTQGVPLGVHPGLRRAATAAGFAAKVEAFLKKHVSEKNLTAMAFMGLPASMPEPWIFVAAARKEDGTFGPAPVPAIGFQSTQMLSFLDQPRVFPEPTPTNRNPISNFLGTPAAERRGVATAALFVPGVKLDDLAVVGRTADGAEIRDPGGDKPLRNQDIPDLIANPHLAHFFSTDCVSCHTESTRRRELKLPENSPFRYPRPEGVSGVEANVLPEEDWNVRNFGWFPSFFKETTKATVTMRTANETADCVEFINREHFGHKK